jgi:hypothetical protein
LGVSKRKNGMYDAQRRETGCAQEKNPNLHQAEGSTVGILNILM